MIDKTFAYIHAEIIGYVKKWDTFSEKYQPETSNSTYQSIAFKWAQTHRECFKSALEQVL